MSAMKMVFGRVCELAQAYVDERGPCQSVDDGWARTAYAGFEFRGAVDYATFKEVLDDAVQDADAEPSIELYDVFDGTLYGRGRSRDAAILDAMRNAYFGRHLIKRTEIWDELARCRETGGALGFGFREV